MVAKTWPDLAVAFATLVVLIGLFTGATQKRLGQIQGSLLELSSSYKAEHDRLDHLRTSLYVSGLLLRDYLSHSASDGVAYKERILVNKQFTLNHLKELQASSHTAWGAQLQSLQSELAAFWSSIEPVLTWTPEQKRTLGYKFLRENVVPQRDAVITLAEELADMGALRLKSEREQVNKALLEFDAYLNRLTFLTLLLTGCVAIASLWRINQLEARSGSEQQRAQEAERAMRGLSQQLVKAQEEERRVLSRELHDELGQGLTSLKVSLRNAQSLHMPQAQFAAILDDCQSLLEQSIQTVRNIAMGLRPSMLDDLGLGPAIEWQAREFSRRYDTPVTVALQDGFDHGLTDAGRTSVYRIVQETLTNCARHAKASRISIHLKRVDGMSVLAVEDDGIGIRNGARTGDTFGLLGIQERVRELGGAFSIGARESGGTAVIVKVPSNG